MLQEYKINVTVPGAIFLRSVNEILEASLNLDWLLIVYAISQP